MSGWQRPPGRRSPSEIVRGPFPRGRGRHGRASPSRNQVPLMSQNALNYESPLPVGRSQSGVRTALSVMMFLEFFIWGAWYVSMGPYMAAAGMGSHIGTAYTLSPIAAIVAPFFLGMIADR